MTIPFRRALALGLVLSFAFLLVPGGAIASEPGVVVGRVLATDGVTPLAGVVVSLVDEKSSDVYAAAPSSARGTFEAKAPAGSYRVVAESPKGAFLAASSVRVAAGANPPVSLMLQQAAGQEGTATPPATPPPPPPGNTLAPWAKWVIVGGIIVTGALVVAAVTDDADEPQASPSGGSGGGGDTE